MRSSGKGELNWILNVPKPRGEFRHRKITSNTSRIWTVYHRNACHSHRLARRNRSVQPPRLKRQRIQSTLRGHKTLALTLRRTLVNSMWTSERVTCGVWPYVTTGRDSGPCRGSREVGRRYVSRHPCHGNGAGYANHNPRVTNHNPRGTVTANRPPLSRRFQFLINFQRQWSHNQS